MADLSVAKLLGHSVYVSEEESGKHLETLLIWQISSVSRMLTVMPNKMLLEITLIDMGPTLHIVLLKVMFYVSLLGTHSC